MQIKMFSFRRITLIAFMMLGIASLSVMVSCSKETGVTPENAQVQENKISLKELMKNNP